MFRCATDRCGSDGGPAIPLGEHGARVVFDAVAVVLADEEDD
jgi:hypothetical protein